jgi:hypothetical protein
VGEDYSFRRHYEIGLIASHIALMAGFIFMMHLPTAVQIGLLIASGLVFGWMPHSRGSYEPPCGADLGGEAIDRPRPEFKP